MTTIDFRGGTFEHGRINRLADLIQGTRTHTPVYTLRDPDGKLWVNTTGATWSGWIRRADGEWRSIKGPLIGLGDGKVRWAVADADDEAHTPLRDHVVYEIQLRACYHGAPAYRTTGKFTLHPGARGVPAG